MAFVKRIMYVLLSVLLQMLVTSGQPCSNVRACYPKIEDLVQRFPKSSMTLSVSSTCGESTPTMYKSLNNTDDTEYTCSLTSNEKRGIIDKVNQTSNIDGDTFNTVSPNFTTYWQSAIAVDNNSQPIEQYIILNFTDVFIINEFQLYFAAPKTDPTMNTDGRPSTMSIERWVNGGWEPWRYFAAENCNHLASVVVEIDTMDDPLLTFCRAFKRNVPEPSLNEKNLHIIELHPSVEYYTEFKTNRSVMDHFSTSAIQVKLTRPAIMDDPLRSYYAIADIKVDAQCLCYGHAQECMGQNENECKCGHNTDGTHCDRCQPLYNNKPWSIGTSDNPSVCELCNCNEHAQSCTYNASKGHGVCSGCLNNTAGDYCNDCENGYFVNPNTTAKPAGTRCSGHNGLGDVDYDCNRYCIPCDCSGKGTEASSNFYCNTTSGQCQCKQNVQGRNCNECKDTFHSLTATMDIGCSPCVCSPVGTFNSSNYCNKTNGACICKTNTDGEMCNRCKPETYGLSAENVEDGCTPCACDKGGAINNQCDVRTGNCTCRTQLYGRDCSNVTAGYFVPKLDYFTFDAEFATLTGASIVEEPGHGKLTSNLTGLGYVQLTPGGSFNLEGSLSDGVTGPFDVLVRYKSAAVMVSVDISIAMKNRVEYTCGARTILASHNWTDTLALTGPTEKSHKAMRVPLCLKGSQTYVITVTSVAANADNILIDSIVFLPNITHLSAYINSPVGVKNQMTSCREVSKNVDLGQRAAHNCSRLEFSLMAEFFNGSLPCKCNATGTETGSTCEPYGGQCSCKDSIIMRDCDHCQVDSYGGSDSTGCVACNCSDIGSVNAFCNDTGHCTCKTNVIGIKCTECLPDNYGLQTRNGCSLCQCNPEYSYNNSCTDDGQCPCKSGVGGQLCDVCLDGFYNLSVNGCTPCGCNADGTVQDLCTKDTGICTCKDNVEGDKCSQCKPGFFGLGSWSVNGCLQCQCSGHSNNCTTAEGWYTTETESHWPLDDKESAGGARWLGEDDLGNDVTVDDPTVFSNQQTDPFAQFVMRLLNNADNLNRTHMYFLAPDKFLGNKRTAYGRKLTIVLRVSSNESMLSGFTEGDVILKGQYLDFSLVREFPTPPIIQKTTYEITMDETGWTVNSTTGQQATYLQMIQTLSSLEAIKIRGKFSNFTDAEVDLFRVIMEHAIKDNSSGGEPINNVEHCTCPETYRGEFCELCGFGYRRKQSFSGSQGECVSCGCNGHAGGPCDEESGICNCTHNTTGNSCNSCKAGFYGNPLIGQPDDCKPCTCPGNVVAGDLNVFASECSLDNATQGPICVNCTTGHGGNMCDDCVAGHYGQPTNVTNNNGVCTPCECFGRADTCDTVTGVCVDCRNNTTGKECSECASLYYGDPLDAPCTACTCNASVGATGDCDNRSGLCTCKPNVEGFSCDQCVALAFNFTSGEGCTMCDCLPNGSIGNSCNLTSGQCTCKSNVHGRQCDTCQDGYWDLTDTGCRACNCDPRGIEASSNAVCDQVSGQCHCQNTATVGRTCDQCTPVSLGNYTYISLFELSSFPSCGLCGECFDGWAEKLEEIGKEVFAQYDEIDVIWQNYNRWSPSDAEPTLTRISANITLAESSIYRVGNFTQLLSTLQASLQQISDRTIAINNTTQTQEQRYNAFDESLQDLKTFVGTVAIDNQTSVSLASLESNVNAEALNIDGRFKEGNTTWQNILGLSILVGDSGDKSRELQERVDTAMRDIAVAMETYSLMVKIYNESFLTGYNNNEKGLSTARGTIQAAEVNLDKLKSIMITVNGQKTLANTTVTPLSARSLSQRDQMAEVNTLSGYTNTLAADVLLEARNTSEIVDNYLALAKTGKDNITTSFSDVIQGINSLRELTAKLDTVDGRGLAISAITLRPLSEMVTLTGEISSIVIPTEIVEKTNEKADSALLTAQMAMNSTAKARDDSLRAKEEVEGIQDALEQATTQREEARRLKLDSDAKNETVHSVIATIQSNSTRVSALATSTSNDINSMFAFINSITQCITSRAVEAGGVKTAAQNTLNKANEAKQNLDSVSSLISNITAKVGQIDATAALSSIETTNSQLDTVLASFGRVEAVTDLQALLQNYINQKAEIDKMETDLTGLESELDTVIQELNTRVLSGTSKCTIN